MKVAAKPRAQSKDSRAKAAKGTFLTDGKRLVEVMDVIGATAWIEDSVTFVYEEIPVDQLNGWEVVEHDGKR